MKTIQVPATQYNLYEYDELSDEAKEKAREWFAEGVYDYDWWDSIYGDAKRIGLEITSFDLDRNRHAEGTMIEPAHEIARLIMQEHGDMCDTYKLAEAYKAEYDAKVGYAALEDDMEEDAIEFKRALLEEYSCMLQRESEYMTSEEYLEEGIIANEYTFLEDGTRHN